MAYKWWLAKNSGIPRFSHAGRKTHIRIPAYAANTQSLRRMQPQECVAGQQVSWIRVMTYLFFFCETCFSPEIEDCFLMMRNKIRLHYKRIFMVVWFIV